MKRIINPVPAEWRALKPGNEFVLVNETAVLAATQGKGPFPIESPIGEIVSLKERNGEIEWLLFRLSAFPEVALFAKIEGETVSASLLAQSLNFAPMSREELVGSDTLFIFGAPTNV